MPSSLRMPKIRTIDDWRLVATMTLTIAAFEGAWIVGGYLGVLSVGGSGPCIGPSRCDAPQLPYYVAIAGMVALLTLGIFFIANTIPLVEKRMEVRRKRWVISNQLNAPDPKPEQDQSR